MLCQNGERSDWKCPVQPHWSQNGSLKLSFSCGGGCDGKSHGVSMESRVPDEISGMEKINLNFMLKRMKASSIL